MRIPDEAAQDRRALRTFLLDHDGDVLEPLGDVVGKRIERGANELFEFLVGHQYLGCSGGRTMNKRTVNAPKTKPPMCAKNATPPPACGWTIENPLSQSWKPNQKPRNRNAGTSSSRKKTSVSTLAVGRSTR